LSGYLLAWRAGVGLALLAVALTRMGVSLRRLVALAFACVVLLPVLYLVNQPPGGAVDFDFARRHLLAHWVAIVALACLTVAATILIRRFRRAAASQTPLDGIAGLEEYERTDPEGRTLAQPALGPSDDEGD